MQDAPACTGNDGWPACKESIRRTVHHFQSVCLGLDVCLTPIKPYPNLLVVQCMNASSVPFVPLFFVLWGLLPVRVSIALCIACLYWAIVLSVGCVVHDITPNNQYIYIYNLLPCKATHKCDLCCLRKFFTKV